MEQYVSGEEKTCYYFSMKSTEEWLRDIESDVIKKQYGLKGYDIDDLEDEDNKKDNEEE